MKEKVKKTLNLVVNVLMYVFLTLCVLTLFITVSSKRVDGAAEVFGYQMRVVTSDSMDKCDETDVSGFDIGSIPLHSMVFIQTVPDDAAEADEWYRSLKVGDVLTFRYVYTSQVTITHRIVSIEEKETGGYIIELSGDNKSSDAELLNQVIDTSEPNSMNYVIGKVTGQAYVFGLMMSVLMSTPGIIFLIIVPCFIIIMLEIFKIARLMSSDKKKLRAEEDAKKDSELEELRRKLAELEALKAESTKTEGDASNEEKEEK